MYELRYLVFIRMRGPFGLTYKVPVLRTAHVDKPALERIRRRFTFEDARQFLMEHPEIFDDLDSQIRAQLLQNPPAIIQYSSTDTDTATDADEDDIDLDDLEEATDGKTEEFILDE